MLLYLLFLATESLLLLSSVWMLKIKFEMNLVSPSEPTRWDDISMAHISRRDDGPLTDKNKERGKLKRKRIKE